MIENVFTDAEIKDIVASIEKHNDSVTPNDSNKDVFALRKLSTIIPGLRSKMFNTNLLSIVHTLFGKDFFMVKAIYFNKPPLSNWFVAYHQDLSIAVADKTDTPNYKNWTIKDNAFGVQPTPDVLEHIYTIRIHLDDCTAQNGALRVIPGSHLRGVISPEKIKECIHVEVVCEVPKGGVMVMRPLLLHASDKSKSINDRRVLHLEFCNRSLPDAVNWAEKESIQ